MLEKNHVLWENSIFKFLTCVGAIVKNKISFSFVLLTLFFVSACSLGMNRTGSVSFDFSGTVNARTAENEIAETAEIDVSVKILNKNGDVYRSISSKGETISISEILVGSYYAEIEVIVDNEKFAGKSELFEVVADQTASVEVKLKKVEEEKEEPPVTIITEEINSLVLEYDENNEKYRGNIDLRTLLPGVTISKGDTLVLKLTAKEFIPQVNYQLLPATYSDNGKIEAIYSLWDRYNTLYQLSIEKDETVRLPMNMVQLKRTLDGDNNGFEPIPEDAEFTVLQLFFNQGDFPAGDKKSLSCTYSIEYHSAAEKYIEFVKSPYDPSGSDSEKEYAFTYKCDYRFFNQKALGANVSNVHVKVEGSSNVTNKSLEVWPVIMENGDPVVEYKIMDEKKNPFGTIQLSNSINYESKQFISDGQVSGEVEGAAIFQMRCHSSELNEPLYIKNFQLYYAVNKDTNGLSDSDFTLDKLSE